jgi:hypothetical protein
MSDFAKFSSSLQSAMEAIGKTNGHSPPASQDPMDAILHEYYVSKLGERLFTDRAELAKKNMLAAVSQDTIAAIQDMINSTIKNNSGESAVLIDAQHYSLDLTTRRGAKRLDQTALKVALQVKHGMPGAVVDALLDSCVKTSDPSKIYSVKPVRGDV